MRPIPALVIALSACLLSAAPPALAQVEPVITYSYYPVTPQENISLHRQLGADTPLRHKGKKAVGLTHSPAEYRYAVSSPTIGYCRVRDLEVTQRCDITLPELVSDDPTLKSDFNAYLALLKDHELTHCRISTTYANRFQAAVQALGERPCDRIKAEIKALGQEMRRAERVEQERFDSNTQLGGYLSRKGRIFLGRSNLPRLPAPAPTGLSNLPAPDPVELKPARPDSPAGETAPEAPAGQIHRDRDGVWRNY
ncbi:MAG: DUF922 domain-containing protein [Candidatus Adiutrix sp.]|jgi:predicted secreted Zn-dependent protease|nr:DUF922 domain-containing protein [Candidatus Adiutrix sp.]